MVQHQQRYIPIKEAARYLQLSVRKVRDLIIAQDDPLPHYRIGKSIRFLASEIDLWMGRNKYGNSGLSKNNDKWRK